MPEGRAPAPPLVVGLADVELVEDEAAAARAAIARGVDLYVGGDVASASQSFDEARRLDPASAEAHYLHGKALRRDPAARAALERAVSLRPGWFEAWRALSVLCRALGDPARSSEAAARARAVAADPAALDRDLAGVLPG